MVEWFSLWKIYIIICGVVLIISALVIALIFKLKRKNKKYINNRNYIPPMPISNIIIEKKRFTYNKMSTIDPAPKNVRVYLELINIITGKVYKFKFKNKLLAGRSMKCKFSIKDALVSKIHCIFIFDGNQLFIQDNNSDNGTILNGIIINDKTPIYSDDLLLIGEKEFKVETWGIE